MIIVIFCLQIVFHLFTLPTRFISCYVLILPHFSISVTFRFDQHLAGVWFSLGSHLVDAWLSLDSHLVLTWFSLSSHVILT